MKKLPIFFGLFLAGLVASAQLRLPALFTDHMVLQQNTAVEIWGWAAANTSVSITSSWSAQPVLTQTDASGKFQTKIKTIGAGGPYILSVAAEGKNISISDVYLGEVWLASGQSNMEFFIGKMKNPSYTGIINHEEVMKDADLPLIRQIDVPNKVADEIQSDFKGEWKSCSSATIDSFSAVAFFFARKIHQATGFPVGIINSTWGGTPAESWTKKEVLASMPGLQKILERYDQQVREFPTANELYKQKMKEWQNDTSLRKGAAPTAPIGPTHSKSPYKLYNGMIAPLLPFTLGGVIWYQGESNADRAFQYQTLFPAMIQQWRNDFNNTELPFYFVQISPHRSQNAEIREAQCFTLKTVPHTGMAVTLDNGDSLDIHPRNKQPVGERLALWALKYQYGFKKTEVSGPMLSSVKVNGNSLQLSFSHARKIILNSKLESEFTIAGADQIFHPAKARVKGRKLILAADEVKEPVAVRYAWKNIPHAVLFNELGLPASPFRSDDWPLKSVNAQ